jgi:hypothetical protein
MIEVDIPGVAVVEFVMAENSEVLPKLPAPKSTVAVALVAVFGGSAMPKSVTLIAAKPVASVVTVVLPK